MSNFLLDPEKLCSDVIAACKETGRWIQENIKNIDNSDIEEKDRNSFVTHIDKQAERQLVSNLSLLLFDADFLTEEKTATPSRKNLTYRWIIDPLDGTTNFIHGLPCYSISVALTKGKEVILGVVYEINNNEMFYSWGGGKSYMNGEQIKATKTNNLKDSLIATGFPYYDYSRMDDYFMVLKKIITETRGVRRFGSAAVDLAYVACGRFDGFFEYGLNPWDVAAGAFIVQNAGGSVSDFSNKDNYIFGKEIVASNNKIHSKLMGIVKDAF